MSLIVKFIQGDEYPGCEDSAAASIYTDVTSVHFPPSGKMGGTAILWVREPIKTALVPGFCENRRNVDITGPVYVMNEQGKTISVFRPHLRARGFEPMEPKTPRENAAAYRAHVDDVDETLLALPYDVAAAVRRGAMDAEDLTMVATLERLQIAVDVPVFKKYAGYEPLNVRD